MSLLDYDIWKICWILLLAILFENFIYVRNVVFSYFFCNAALRNIFMASRFTWTVRRITSFGKASGRTEKTQPTQGKQNRWRCTYQRAVECGWVHADGRVRVLLTGGVGGAVHGARSSEARADSWVGPECQAVVLARAHGLATHRVRHDGPAALATSGTCRPPAALPHQELSGKQHLISHVTPWQVLPTLKQKLKAVIARDTKPKTTIIYALASRGDT